LSLNEVKLQNEYIRDPFNDASGQEKHEHLSTDRTKVSSYKIENLHLLAEFSMSDRMFIRQRSVLDLVTLITEVSGFADMFMVCATLLLGKFY
jgi:hypothetical protein